MTNKDLWEQYQDYTKLFSENTRTLALSAAAIAWSFRNQPQGLPLILRLSLLAIVAFFIADALQYIIPAVLLRGWIREQEKKFWKKTRSLEGTYNKPTWLDRPSYVLWWAKTVFILLGYAGIGAYLVHAL